MSAAVTAPVAATMLTAPAMFVAEHAQRAARFLIGRLLGHAAFDDLVEFAAIEPDSPALRAIIDFDALPLAHDEIDFANGARQALMGSIIYHDKSFQMGRADGGTLMRSV